ncbi:MAG: hypothetical protein WA738_05605 [Candidatus Angelobacter sp.]
MSTSASVYCGQCGEYHASLRACPHWKIFSTVPLPPTAEETSIGRFNALADQIRGDNARREQEFQILRENMAQHFSLLDTQLKLTNQATLNAERLLAEGHEKIKRMIAGTNQHVSNMEMDIARHVSLKVDSAFATLRINGAVAMTRSPAKKCAKKVKKCR